MEKGREGGIKKVIGIRGDRGRLVGKDVGTGTGIRREAKGKGKLKGIKRRQH